MKFLASLFGSSALLVVVVACGPSGENGNAGGGGSGVGASGGTGSGTGGDVTIITGSGTGTGSGAGSGTGTDCSGVLQAMVRDFSPATHPDFEYALGDDRGLVATNLGADGKPVYAGGGGTPTTHGQAYFDQWFRDTPGVNLAIPTTLTLGAGAEGVFTYDNQAFFPVDGQGHGDEGNPHNYHFTLELRTKFEYRGGEVFTFTGDDDLFTFINGRLAIDLGGVHGAESASVDLDARAAELGITVGNVYTLDLFFAERHLVDSHFRIDTTIACFSSVLTPE